MDNRLGIQQKSSLASRKNSPIRTRNPFGTDRTPKPKKQDDPIGTATVKVNALTVRSGAGTNFPRIGGLTKGKVVEVYEDKGDWLKIKYKTEFGYVMKMYTNFEPKEPSTLRGKTTGKANMRTEPNQNCTILGQIAAGIEVDILGKEGEYYKIDSACGYVWIHESLVTTPISEDTFPTSADNTPPDGVACSSEPTLHHHDNTNDKNCVKTMQLYLNKYLASSGVAAINADGDFGDTTWRNLMYYQYSRNLQGSKGIEVDGICGPKTWDAFKKGAPVVYDIRKPIAFKDYKPINEEVKFLSTGGALCAEAAKHFEEMIAEAKKDASLAGKISVLSSFRGMTRMGTEKVCGTGTPGQIELMVENYHNGTDTGAPGASQHQCGKAVDFGDIHYNKQHPFYMWLDAHAAKYGFKELKYAGGGGEPWHWNYEGV